MTIIETPTVEVTTPKRAKLYVVLAAHTIFTNPLDENGDAIMPIPPWSTGDGESSVQGKIQCVPEFGGRACYQSWDRPGKKTRTNQGYLANILRQKHESVLEHASVSFYVTGVSRALTHELVRHRHLSYSQLSQRYVPSDNIRFVVPPAMLEEFGAVWDTASARWNGEVKSPRTGELVTREEGIDEMAEEWCANLHERHVGEYEAMAEFLGPEQSDIERKPKQIREAARAELPNATETRIMLTGNFRAWKHFLIQRDSSSADAEMQLFAAEIGRQLAEIAPNIFGAEARALWDDGVEHGEAQTPEA
ncbi:ThyX-like thymidylate synthase [Rhodococcus phage GuyFagieri]|nr:ThyX-like thymidylate synthase [Rhodococcus phage GuyFagieri]